MIALLRLYQRVVSFLEMITWLPPLLGRVSVGMVFLVSGWGKLHNLPKVIEFFGRLGIPAPHLQAPFVASTELFCGALLIVGLGTRLASLPLIGTMVVAIATAKRSDISELSDLLGMSEFLMIVVLVWLVVSGPGAVALDRWASRQATAAGAPG
jgi:putative oxidoreductase